MYTTSLSLPSLSLAITLLHQTTQADTTMPAISEYPDGQPQAPTASYSSYSYDSSSSWTPTTTWSTSSVSSYDNPFTIYTTMTNSLGVITGMPSVWTSQPSQPPSATLPILSGYYYNTTTSSASSTTMATSTLVVSASVTTTTGSSSAVPTFAQVTGAASANKVAGAGVGLIVAALGFCML